MSSNERSDSKIDFKQVKERVSTTFFFENVLGLKPKPLTGGVRYAGCPSCGNSENPMSVRVNVRANGKWHCFSCGSDGDVIDAAVFHYHVSELDAAKILMKDVGIPENIRQWKLKERQPLRPQPKIDYADTREAILRLLEAGKKAPLDRQVVQYLTGRGISEQVIHAAHEQNMIVTLPSNPSLAKKYLVDVVGKPLLEKAGWWHQGKKAPGASFRPLAFVTANAKSIEFRLIRKAVNESEVRMISYGPMTPFFFAGPAPDEYVITEGMTDLLSVLTFGSKKSIIGLPGCTRWEADWFARMSGKDVMLALDGDEPGQKAAFNLNNPEGRSLIRTLQEFQARVSTFEFPENFLSETPEDDWDINGYLRWIQSKRH
ncbi:toprim domain-containing protein [Allopusillimonas ginsengisoli]|uniref:toprim domain-containing protein n=1 Tax=Allopusillimonas ginsengisoli TaxID=453575 RepID=UPI0039C3A25B